MSDHLVPTYSSVREIMQCCCTIWWLKIATLYYAFQNFECFHYEEKTNAGGGAIHLIWFKLCVLYMYVDTSHNTHFTL